MRWLHPNETDREGPLLTRAAGDVDINADVRDAASLEGRHARVGPEIRELQVDDVQVGGAGGHVGVGLGDHHPLRAPQGPPVLEPAEGELLRGDGLHLARDLHLPPDLDVVIFVIRVRGDPESSFF